MWVALRGWLGTQFLNEESITYEDRKGEKQVSVTQSSIIRDYSEWCHHKSWRRQGRQCHHVFGDAMWQRMESEGRQGGNNGVRQPRRVNTSR